MCRYCCYRIALLMAAFAMISCAQSLAQPFPGASEVPGGVWIEHIDGDLYGARPYTDVGANLFPLLDDYASLMFHASGRVTNEGRGGASFGLHQRFLLDGFLGPAIVGGGLWYDLSQTRSENVFHQGSFSTELLMPDWSFRANGYHPIGPSRRNSSIETRFDPPRFSGNNLLVDPRTFFFDEEALKGVDVEVAKSFLEQTGEAYIGYYFLDGDHTDETSGIKGGVRGFLTDHISGSVTVAHDSLFGTSVFGGVTVTFGSAGRLPLSFYDRLLSRVQRNMQLTVNNIRRVIPGDPITLTENGTPIEFAHVNSSAASGDGTFETPFGALAAANGDANKANRDVVYVHGDSVFSGQSYELSPNQRLLGEGAGVMHFVDTDQFGLVGLPAATSGVSAPVIDGVAGAAVTANESTEISNFRITNSTTGLLVPALNGRVDVSNLLFNGNGSGVTLDAFNGTLVSRAALAIHNSAGNGLTLNGGTGIVVLEELTINEAAGEGLQTQVFQGALTVTGRTVISNTTGSAVFMNETIGSLQFADLTIDQAESDGIRILRSDGNLTVAGPTIITRSGFHGMFIELSDGEFHFNDLFVDRTGREGIGFTDFDGEFVATGNTLVSRTTWDAVRVADSPMTVSNGAVTFANLFIDQPGLNGLFGLEFDGTFTVTGDTRIADAGVDGIDLVDGTGTFSFGNLSIDQTVDRGIHTTRFGGDFTVAGTTQIANTGRQGMRLRIAGGDFRFGDLTIENTANSGIGFENFSGSFNVTGATSISNTGGRGMRIRPVGLGGSGSFTFADLMIDQTATEGLEFRGFDGQFTATGMTVITNTTTNGVLLLPANMINGDGDITFANLAISQTGTNGIESETFEGIFTVTGETTIANATSDGIRLDMSAPAVFTFSNLTVDTVGDDGLDFETFDGIFNAGGITTISNFGDQAIVFPAGAGTVNFANPPVIVP